MTGSRTSEYDYCLGMTPWSAAKVNRPLSSSYSHSYACLDSLRTCIEDIEAADGTPVFPTSPQPSPPGEGANIEHRIGEASSVQRRACRWWKDEGSGGFALPLTLALSRVERGFEEFETKFLGGERRTSNIQQLVLRSYLSVEGSNVEVWMGLGSGQRSACSVQRREGGRRWEIEELGDLKRGKFETKLKKRIDETPAKPPDVV